MAATPAWLAAVEALFNRCIHVSMPASALAHRLDGSALRLEIDGLAPIRISVTGGRLALAATDLSAAEAPIERVDATIAGSPFALLNLAREAAGAGRATTRPSVSASRTTIRGDAEIANLYRQLIAAAWPDLEEELSRWVGDLPARHLSRLTAGAAAWVRKAHRTAGRNLAEYLQEESRDLVSKTEVEEFLQSVDEAREAADRIEARLARLEQRLKMASL